VAELTAYLGWKIDFSRPLGEAALLHPGSVQWRVYKNPLALAVGGVAAVLLEFADPRIRSGVWDHSTYKADPIGRSRRTGIAAMVGVYGPASAARRVIAGVGNMHARVSGATPGGETYRALDPDLLGWVSATAAYGFLSAYDRFVAPVPPDDRARYWRDGHAVARLYGVQASPGSTADFLRMMDGLAGRFEGHPIVAEFLDMIQSGRALPGAPKFLHRAVARAAVSLLPPIVRTRLSLGEAYDLTVADRMTIRVVGALAETRIDPRSPACQASVRLGLPGDFLYRRPADQALALRRAGLVFQSAHDQQHRQEAAP
jgi:uncharacterized protein (DUF2236 family)